MTFRLAVGVVLALLCSCSRTGSDAPAETQPDAARGSFSAAITEPVQIVTQSGVEMVFIPGAEFMMGSDKGNPDEAPAHKVRLSSFLIDKYEVTHEMFAKAQLPNPSHWQDHPRKPVERVRWRDAKLYCNERSLLEGLQPCYDEKTQGLECDFEAGGYRLPTEAEWEYACRAGASGAYDFGPANKLREHSWFDENAQERTHPVGQKKPNRWGLHDMYGNVSEWCEDVYSPDYYRTSPAQDPRGPAGTGKETRSTLRGGSWKASANMCRATFRQGQRTGDADACFYTDFCGFRCVRKMTTEDLSKLRNQLKP